MGALPFAGYYCFSKVSQMVTIDISRRVLKHLPRTPAVDSAVEYWHHPIPSPPASPTLAATPNQPPRNSRDISRPDPPSNTPNGPPTSAGIPRAYGFPTSAATPTTPTRRPSSVALGGEEFVSDDEDEEGVSATFISFDVEPTTTTDPSPAVWSAELRQNVAEGATTEGKEPVYRDSNLVRLPPLLAADVFGAALSRIFLAPHESQIWLGLARLFASRQGLPLDGFHEFGFRQVGVLRMMVNAVGVEMLFFMLRCEIWGLITLLAHLVKFDEAEWMKVSETEENEGA